MLPYAALCFLTLPYAALCCPMPRRSSFTFRAALGNNVSLQGASQPDQKISWDEPWLISDLWAPLMVLNEFELRTAFRLTKFSDRAPGIQGLTT